MIADYKKHGRVDHIDCYIGNKVKLRRLISGLSQEDIGKVLGVSIQQIQKYEKGINRISCANLYRIGKVLNIPVTYFFEDIEDNIPKKAQVMEFENKPQIVNDKEIFILIKAYNRIVSIDARKKIIELMAIVPNLA